MKLSSVQCLQNEKTWSLRVVILTLRSRDQTVCEGELDWRDEGQLFCARHLKQAGRLCQARVGS